MYAKEISDRALAAASAAQGWEVIRHSPADIASAISHFDDLRDPTTGVLTRALQRDEQRFIENEQIARSLDFLYYLNYVHVVGWDKRDVIFTPNLSQRIIMDMWADSERRGHAIFMMMLKARQLGMTTLAEIAVGHRVQLHPHTYAVIASADPEKTVAMSGMIDYSWQQMPWWLMPTPTKMSRGMAVEFGEIHSTLSPQWGNKYHGVGRGQTPNVFHVSELSSWSNAADDIDSALLKAIHPSPDVFGIMESTALGRGNWWYDKWQSQKVEYPAGRSLIRPVFLPWFAGVDIYPTDTEHRTLPPPANWQPKDRTLRHAERARTAVLANPLWLHYIANDNRDWQMPRRQLWYYEREREVAIAENRLNKFLSEMPADDMEAFQNQAISVVDQEVILNYRERALARAPLGVYTIAGAEIHQSLIVPRSQWDFSKPAITIVPSAVCRATETYQLIPVRFDGYIGCDPMGKLFIWERPEDLSTYGVGVDTSDGIGKDWSVIEGFRKGSIHRPHAQVFEFASPYIKAGQLWDMTLAVSSLYSVVHPRAGRRVQCRVCIECKGNGEKVQDELQKRGWSNFHPWKRLDNRKRTTNDKVYKIGVMTNVWYRALLMDTLLTQVDEEYVDIASPWLVNELETLERDPEQQSARAAYNTHDDRVMAFAFPLESLTVDDRERTKSQRATPKYMSDELDPDQQLALGAFATYQPPMQARSDLRGRNVIPLEHRRSQYTTAPASTRSSLGRYVNHSMPKKYRNS